MILISISIAILCLVLVIGSWSFGVWLWRDDERWLGAGALAFALSLTLFVAGSAYAWGFRDDPFANRLCLRGHQEWVRSSGTRLMAVGKMWVSQPYNYRSKQWICAEWEAQ